MTSGSLETRLEMAPEKAFVDDVIKPFGKGLYDG